MGGALGDAAVAEDGDKANPRYSGKWWIKEIAAFEKEADTKWRDSADKILDKYLNEEQQELTSTPLRKYNIFWANVQIQKSALYATPPKPTVARQHGDAKDDVARTAALILQRMLEFGVTKDQSDMHKGFQHAVEDRLLPGMGQVWLRYDVKTKKVPSPMDPSVVMEVIEDEQAITEHVNWRDFLWSPARTWGEVWWVGRRLWLSKVEFSKRFGDARWKELQADLAASSRNGDKLPKGFRKGRVEVFEVWCRENRKVYWVSSTLEDVLKSQDDPLGLKEFYPCPEPLMSTHTTRNFYPRADYSMCQDQYEELDLLNSRIYTLTKALRVVGVYDNNNGELKKLFTASELDMIPVENWAVFGESGGFKGAVDWFPVEQVGNVLTGLVEQRAQVVAQIYEITSISDIMRGASNPRETAKAQSLKAQYSSVRLQLTQQDVGSFVRSAMRLKAEIISNKFQPETIIRQSGIEFTESGAFAQPAIELIKMTGVVDYRIEISEESLSIADYNAEREMRMEYLTAVGQFLSQAGPTVEAMPGSMPYLLRLVQWATSSFRGSSDVESVLDEAVKAAEQAPPPPQEQEKPDHSLEAAQITAQKDLQIAQMDNDTKRQIAEQDRQLKVLLEQSKLDQEDRKAAREAEDSAKEEMEDAAESQVVEQLKATMEGFQEIVKKLAEGQAQIAKNLEELSAGLESLRLKKKTVFDPSTGQSLELREEYMN
jgi:hypothetical protein